MNGGGLSVGEGHVSIADGRGFVRVANFLVAHSVVEEQAGGRVRPVVTHALHVHPGSLDGIEQARRQVRADDRDQAHLPTQPAGDHGGV